MRAHACAAFGGEIYVRGRPRVLQATRVNIYCARETQSPGSPCRIERARVDCSEARRSTQRRVDMNWVAICDDNSDDGARCTHVQRAYQTDAEPRAY